MPCQCATTAFDPTRGACECATEPGGSCECAGGSPMASDRETSLERIVMELDKRVRKLETAR